jgi:hypothetical protein
MTRKRVVAGSAHAARRKAKGKKTVVTKVNYIKGTKKGNKKTYQVITKKKK